MSNDRAYSYGTSIINTIADNLKQETLKRKNILGLTLCVIIFCLGFVINRNIGLYFNLSGLLIVVGGTFGATLVSFRMERICNVYKVLSSSYRTRVKKPEEIVEILVDLSVKSKFRGILSLQEDEKETSIMFLRRALGLLVDGYSEQQTRNILNSEMYFFRLRREESERVVKTMAEMSPAFGMVGSVVGLISMLAGVGDTSIILATVPIALTSTLYGIIFGYFLFIPFAANIRERTDQELLLQKIIMEGVIAIESELHPRVLEIKLKSFLTPAARKGKLVSLKRIQEKFKIKPEPLELSELPSEQQQSQSRPSKE